MTIVRFKIALLYFLKINFNRNVFIRNNCQSLVNNVSGKPDGTLNVSDYLFDEKKVLKL